MVQLETANFIEENTGFFAVLYFTYRCTKLFNVLVTDGILINRSYINGYLQISLINRNVCTVLVSLLISTASSLGAVSANTPIIT